jgi:hypothetical protein
MCELRGQDVNIEVHEINEDANVIGADAQAKWVTRFYDEVARRNLSWLTNITYYMFRDRGGLGLEKEDVKDSSVFEEQPALEAYRNAIRQPCFDLRTEATNASPKLPLNFRWVSSTEADGFEFTYVLPQKMEQVKLSFSTHQQLLIKSGEQWVIKPAGQSILELPCDPSQGTFSIQVFAVPADGKNNIAGAYVTQMSEPPGIAQEERPALALEK